MPPLPNGSGSRDIDAVLCRVRETVSTHRMIAAGDRVAVAVSGGPDSVALLDILDILAKEHNVELAVAHVNHGLRPEADADAAFVEKLAARYHRAFFPRTVAVAALSRKRRMGIEECARTERYAFFHRLVTHEGFDKVALGHHADDNAEQVLMALVRGAGPEGLAGIPPVRDAFIVRPLLALTRATISRYVRTRGLVCRTDATNADPRFTRNRVRHRLLPLIRAEFNPAIVGSLNRHAVIAADENRWLAALVDELWKTVAVEATPAGICLDADAVNALPHAARRRVLRRAIQRLRGDLRRFGMEHIEAMVNLAQRSSRAGIDLPDGVRAEISGTCLRLTQQSSPARGRRRRPASATFEYAVSSPPESLLRIALKETGATIVLRPVPAPVDFSRGSGHQVAFFDMDTIDFPLLIRSVRAGDRMIPLGLGHHKKVARLLMDRKIPRDHRREVPIIADQRKIIWVAGVCISDRVRLTAHTRRALRAEWRLPGTI